MHFYFKGQFLQMTARTQYNHIFTILIFHVTFYCSIQATLIMDLIQGRKKKKSYARLIKPVVCADIWPLI